jgi:hypothetical protein
VLLRDVSHVSSFVKNCFNKNISNKNVSNVSLAERYVSVLE